MKALTMFGAELVLAEISGFLVLLTASRVSRFAAILAALLFLPALLALLAGFTFAGVVSLLLGFSCLDRFLLGARLRLPRLCDVLPCRCAGFGRRVSLGQPRCAGNTSRAQLCASGQGGEHGG